MAVPAAIATLTLFVITCRLILEAGTTISRPLNMPENDGFVIALCLTPNIGAAVAIINTDAYGQGISPWNEK